MEKARIAIFASGSGTNAEAIMKHFAGHPDISVVLILSNNPKAFALERARKFAVPTYIFSRDEFRVSTSVLNVLKHQSVTHIVLAGFLLLVPGPIIRAFPDRIVNIHPALLPRHGGKGMYGERVHQAVKSSGDRETGITIHLVNDKFDDGKILFQASCPVTAEDNIEQIADNVHQLEHQHFPSVIEKWIEGRFKSTESRTT
jgi:phosphoribosylglycinamide formyltransferase-1